MADIVTHEYIVAYIYDMLGGDIRHIPPEWKKIGFWAVAPDLAKDKDWSHSYDPSGGHRESGWRVPVLIWFPTPNSPEDIGVYIHLYTDVLFFRHFVGRKTGGGTITARYLRWIRWEDAGSYKKTALYPTYEANRLVPSGRMRKWIEEIQGCEPEEIDDPRYVLAEEWREALRKYTDQEQGKLSPRIIWRAMTLRLFARLVAKKIIREATWEWPPVR